MQSFQRSVLRSALAATRVATSKGLVLAIPRTIHAPFRTVAPVSRLFSTTFTRAVEETLTGENAKPVDVDDVSVESEETLTAESAKPVDVDAVSEELEEKLEDAANEAKPQITLGEDGELPHGLFIRNMVFEATENHLDEAYSKYGTVTKVVLAKDSRGLSRGYGFVWFSNAQEVEKAIEGTDGSFWHGRRINVTPRTPRSPRQRAVRTGNADSSPKEATRSLFIGNIPYETTDTELNKLFKSLDGVKDIRVAVDRTTGWPRGFAHVDFHSVDDATNAMNTLEGTEIEGRSLRLDYASDYTSRGQSDNRGY